MEKITFTSLDCLFEVMIEEFEGQISLCLTELEIDEEKSYKNHTHYKQSSKTEVYFGYEELARITNAFEHILSSDDNEV